MKTRIILGLVAASVAIAAVLYHQGIIPREPVDNAIATSQERLGEFVKSFDKADAMPVSDANAPETKEDASGLAVTVAEAKPQTFVATVHATGSLVAREEILVAAEVDGLRVVSVDAEVGDKVEKGDILARLERETLESQLAQNTAALARADAGIAQAQSLIAETEARVAEAEASLKRAKPLRSSGYLSDSLFDQRSASAKSAQARLVSARDGLALARADRARSEAERRELEWRLERTEIRAPAAGVVSRRTVRLGAIASAAAEPLFRIIANGEIELDAEVEDQRIGQVMAGQPVSVDVAGVGKVTGKVRLVYPEIDAATRLGSVRILLGADPRLKIGTFARGLIETARSRGLAVPASAVLYTKGTTSVQRVVDGRVKTAKVETGLTAGGLVEIRKGLNEGDLVVAKSGTFLRDGDAVRPVRANPVVSIAR